MPTTKLDQALAVVVIAGMALLLWRGGYDDPAHVVFAGLGLAAYLLAGRPSVLDAAVVGLLLLAAATAAAFAAHRDDASLAIALSTAALPLWYLAAVALPGTVRAVLPISVVIIAATSAVAGLLALAMRHEPYAERIDGIWRAGGTLEYPPALALLMVMALALLLGLGAELTTAQAVALGVLLLAAVAGSFDRLAALEAVAVLGLFAARVPAARRRAGLVAVTAVVAIAIVVAVARPPSHEFTAHAGHDPLAGRSAAWSDAWHATLDRPALGIGPGRYAAIHPPHSRELRQAHDEPLQRGVEGGVVAALGAALVLAVLLLRGARNLAGREPAVLAWACAALALALSALTDFTWSYPPIALLGLLALAELGRTTPGSGRPAR